MEHQHMQGCNNDFESFLLCYTSHRKSQKQTYNVKVVLWMYDLTVVFGRLRTRTAGTSTSCWGLGQDLKKNAYLTDVRKTVSSKVTFLISFSFHLKWLNIISYLSAWGGATNVELKKFGYPPTNEPIGFDAANSLCFFLYRLRIS